MNPGCDDAFRPNASVRKLQRQMAALFEKQVVKGGIIDVEAERIKFLVPEVNVLSGRGTPEVPPNGQALFVFIK